MRGDKQSREDGGGREGGGGGGRRELRGERFHMCYCLEHVCIIWRRSHH